MATVLLRVSPLRRFSDGVNKLRLQWNIWKAKRLGVSTRGLTKQGHCCAYLVFQIVHGDLAARNVLVFEDNIVKVTDFGLSKQLYAASEYVLKRQVRNRIAVIVSCCELRTHQANPQLLIASLAHASLEMVRT